MDHPSVSLVLLRNHPAGCRGKQHERAIEATIDQLIKLIPASTNNINADSKLPELLNALSYCNHKCILASPCSHLEHHFGPALLLPGNGCDFLSHDNLKLSRHGVELIHTWAVSGGSVHVEDSFLWEQPAGWQYRAENVDARAVCHRMIVLRGLGKQLNNIKVVHCIIFANDEGGLTTIPTGSFSVNAKRVAETIEESEDLSAREKILTAREELVNDCFAADVMDGFKESFATRKENLNARELDLQAAEDVISLEELLAEREETVDTEDEIMESRKENLASCEELTNERKSGFDTAEQAMGVYEDAVKARERDISSCEETIACCEQEVKQREFDIEKTKQDVAIREIQVTEREVRQKTAQMALTEKEKYLCSERMAIACRERALKSIESTLAKHHSEYKAIMSQREQAMSMREGSVSVLEINLKCNQNAFSVERAGQAAALEAREKAVNIREIRVADRELANETWKKEQVELEDIFTQRVAAEDARTVIHDAKAKQLLELSDTLAKREKEQNRREANLEKREYDIKLRVREQFQRLDYIEAQIRLRGEEKLRNGQELMVDLEKQAVLVSLEADGYSVITISTGSEDAEEENIEYENGEDADVEDEDGEDDEDWENEEIEPPAELDGA